MKNGILRVFDAFNHTLHWVQIAFEVAFEKSYTATFSQDIMPNFTVSFNISCSILEKVHINVVKFHLSTYLKVPNLRGINFTKKRKFENDRKTIMDPLWQLQRMIKSAQDRVLTWSTACRLGSKCIFCHLRVPAVDWLWTCTFRLRIGRPGTV